MSQPFPGTGDRLGGSRKKSRLSVDVNGLEGNVSATTSRGGSAVLSEMGESHYGADDDVEQQV